MGFLRATKNKFTAEQVDTIVMKNDARTFIIGSKFTKKPNTLVDYWNLLLYEIHGGAIEIEYQSSGLLGSKKESSMGYLCDEVGATIPLERSVPNKKNPFEQFEVSPEFLDSFEFKKQSQLVPYILISNKGKKLTVGGTIRKAGLVLTNGSDKKTGKMGPVYRIFTETIEIIDIRTGFKGIGYLCDESGQTVKIDRDIQVWMPDPIKKRKMSDGEECEFHPIKIRDEDRVTIKGKFAGQLGQLMGIDKIQEFFDFGNATMSRYKNIAIGMAIMGFLWMVFR